MSSDFSEKIPQIKIPSPITRERLFEIASEMRSGEAHDVRVLQIGRFLDFPEYPLLIDFEDRILESGNKVLPVPKIGMKILKLLAGNADKPFNRYQIHEQVWGPNAIGDTHVFDVHNSNLRRKVITEFGIQYPIRNIHGVGFVFDSVPRQIEEQ